MIDAVFIFRFPPAIQHAAPPEMGRSQLIGLTGHMGIGTAEKGRSRGSTMTTIGENSSRGCHGRSKTAVNSNRFAEMAQRIRRRAH
jgi:hypothetical protein